MPTTARPSTMAATVSLTAWMAEPTAKSASAMSTTRRRPSRSASTDEKGDTSSASSDVTDVMTLLSSAVSSRPESAVPIETSVEEMTPVSSAKGPGRERREGC